MNYFKTKDWGLLRRFANYFSPYKLYIFLSLVSIPVTAASGVVFLWLIERIIDGFVALNNSEGLVTYVVYLVLTMIVGFLFDALYIYSFTKAGNLAIVDLREDLFARALRFPLRYFDRRPIGVTLSRLTNDMDTLVESFASGLLGLLADSIKALSLLVYLLLLDWKLTIVVCMVAPPFYLLIRFLRKKIRETYNIARASLAQSIAYLQEALAGMKTTQLYSAEKEVYSKYNKLNKEFCDTQNRNNVYESSLFSVVDGITSIAVAAVIWFGATRIQNFDLTVGVLIVVISSANRLFVPIKQFAQQVSTIQRALSVLQHINELFEQPLEENEEINHNIFDDNFQLQEIEFKDVWFRYSEELNDILKGISFKLRRGERIALVGTTGSGKSTIIKLLTKAYKGYRGSITINGVELSSIPLKRINSVVSVMQQDVYLFNNSVAFNIHLGREGISDNQIKQSAEFVYADKFISQLPNKYNFQVENNGSNLSRGQTQLISFARVISGNRDLIILDEATSAVDSITENYIQKAIENIFNTKTVIAIAHRLSTIKNLDTILVLDDGKIVERGSHSSLLKNNGLYSKLVNEFANH